MEAAGVVVAGFGGAAPMAPVCSVWKTAPPATDMEGSASGEQPRPSGVTPSPVLGSVEAARAGGFLPVPLRTVALQWDGLSTLHLRQSRLPRPLRELAARLPSSSPSWSCLTAGPPLCLKHATIKSTLTAVSQPGVMTIRSSGRKIHFHQSGSRRSRGAGIGRIPFQIKRPGRDPRRRRRRPARPLRSGSPVVAFAA